MKLQSQNQISTTKMNSHCKIATLLILLCLVSVSDGGPVACLACCVTACAGGSAATGPLAVATGPSCVGICLATFGLSPIGICAFVCGSPTP